MFRHYCVIFRELVVSALLRYITMSMQSLEIQFKISYYHCKVKVKVTLEKATKVQKGSIGIALLFI